MDSDKSGEITVQEFKQFLETSAELQQHLHVMGIDENELDGLLKLMDKDGSGALDCHEFVPSPHFPFVLGV